MERVGAVGRALVVRVLGEPTVAAGDGSVPPLALRGRALLWYLAAQPGRAFSRAHLASLLFENADPALARHNLASVLSRLHAALPVSPLRVTRETVAWDDRADVEVDALRFLELTDGAGRNPAPAGTPPGSTGGPANASRARLAEAVALWRGPFLAGFELPDSDAYEEWLRAERQVWERRVVAALARLAQGAEAARDWTELSSRAREALAVDPLDERFHRWLMRALRESGDRAGALRQYEALGSLLREELGVEPSPETVALRDAIARDAGGPARGAREAALRGSQARAATRARHPARAARRRRAGGERGRAPRPGRRRGVHRAGGVKGRDAPPFVGREAELARLAQFLASAWGRTRAAAPSAPPRALLIHGEAGVGKTRLLEEFAARGGLRAARRVALGRCHEETRDLPFAPLVEALGGLVPDFRAALASLPAAWRAEVGRLLPELAPAEGVAPRPAADAAEGSAGGPREARLHLYQGLARLLASAPRPLLLAVEDLHLADEETLALLAYLARSGVPEAGALLLTARSGDLPEPAERTLRRLEREGVLDRLELAPLSRPDVEALVAAARGRPDEALAERLHRRTGGNALFVVELLRSLASGGHGQGEDPAVPGSLRALVGDRLARLAPDERALAEAASAFGRPASFGCVVRAAGLTRPAGEAALDTLVRMGILREAGSWEEPVPGVEALGEPALVFRHELIREAVLAEMSQARRARVHARAYESLVATAEAAPPGLAEQLAQLATRAGLWAEGMAWSLAAAERAERAHAYASAARLMRQALLNLERLPDSAENRSRRVDLRLRAAELSFRHDPRDSEDLLEAAAIEARVAGDAGLRQRALADRALSFVIRGRLGRAASLLERLVSLARASRSETLLAHALAYTGYVEAARGDLRRAAALLEEARSLHARLGSPLPEAEAAGALASVYAGLGRFERAAALAGEYAERGREARDLAVAALLLAHLASVAHFAGRWADAVRAASQGLAFARAGDHRLHEYVASVFLGLPLAREGDLEAGIRAQETSIALAERVGMRVLVDRAHAWLAEMRLSAGDLDRAESHAREGLRIAEADGYLYGIALNQRVLGPIAGARGRGDEARELVRSALRRFTSLGARPEAARCHALLARCAEDGVARTEHRRHARRMFRSMGMAWDLENLERSAG